ncbi:MAG: hypothetical protein GX597_25705 [Anaerolineaceae bacterium]|nr:hypothetical protein [Anaerolineaceae bacterium]
MNTERYKELFINRHDAYALQQADGRYILRKEAVTDQVVEEHLLGRVTCGWYCLNPEGKAKWACLDADHERGIQHLQQIHDQLTTLQLPSYLEESREGRGHLWLFVEPIAPRPLRQLLQAVAPDNLECFPKQDRLGEGGYGSLVRGPLGVHRKTGKRYGFLDPETLERVGGNLGEQLAYLETVRIASGVAIAEALAEVTERRPKAQREPLPSLGLDIVVVASRFTPLEKRGSYYVGLCPLHPEEHHSFAVYPHSVKGGRWFCFHEYRGGDAVSLYAEVKGLSYRQAWEELRGELGRNGG